MAVSFSGALPQLENVTTGAANVCTQIILPAGVAKITFRPRGADAKVSFGASASGLTDGGALGAAKHVTLATDAYSQIAVDGTMVFFLTSASAATVVEVVIEGAS